MHSMKVVPTVGLVLCAAQFAGCDAAPTDPASASLGLLFSSTQTVVQSVTGTAHIDFASGEDVFFRSKAFTALKKADGSVSGMFELNARHVPIRVHGHITCFSLADNQAWLGGFIDQSSDPTLLPPGTAVRWRVVDNGQGVGSPPDQVSGTAVGGNPAAYCANMPAVPALSDLTAGNVRVRG